MVTFWKSIQDKFNQGQNSKVTFACQNREEHFYMLTFFPEEVERSSHTKQPFPHHKPALLLLGNRASWSFLLQTQKLIYLEKMQICVQANPCGYDSCNAITEYLILPPIHAKYHDFFQSVKTEFAYELHGRKTYCFLCDSPYNSHARLSH